MKTLSVNCSQCGVTFQKPVSYIKQGEKRGYPNHFCSVKCSCLFNRNKNSNILPQIRKEQYLKNPTRCPNCNSIIDYKDKNWKTYCSKKCCAIYTQKDGGHCHWSEKDKKRISKWAKKYAYRFPKKEKLKKVCLFCDRTFEVLPSKNHQICCSRKCKNSWIVKTGFLKGKNGGFRPNSGTSKKGWYKGYWCGSSWELAWLIFQLEHGVVPQRNNRGFDYTYNGLIKKYYPDFMVVDEYIEIKGYHSKQVDAKISQFPHKLTVLHKNDLSEVFQYVEQKYGKDFVELYEKKV